MDIQEVKHWYHSIPIGDYVTPGEVTLEQEMQIAALIPQDLHGLTVLDIGAWDGFYSFLAEQRGAKRVVAIDPMTFTSQPRYAAQSLAGFHAAKEALGSQVEYYPIGVDDLERLLGEFDVVFMFSVLPHLWDPLRALKNAANKARKLLLIEGNVIEWPIRSLVYEFDEYAGPYTGAEQGKAWRLSRGLLEKLIKNEGFGTIEMHRLSDKYSLTYEFEWRNEKANGGETIEIASYTAFFWCERSGP